MNLAGASVEFTAHHFSPKEGWHRHTWCVSAWWPMGQWHDGRRVRARLLGQLRRLSHREKGQRRFPNEIWSNEQLVRALQLPKFVVRLNIDRPGHHVEAWCVDGRV